MIRGFFQIFQEGELDIIHKNIRPNLARGRHEKKNLIRIPFCSSNLHELNV